MLLVMHTAGILQSSEAEQSQLWKLTWDRIDTFLPKLRSEVFKPHTIGKSSYAVLNRIIPCIIIGCKPGIQHATPVYMPPKKNQIS